MACHASRLGCSLLCRCSCQLPALLQYLIKLQITLSSCLLAGRHSQRMQAVQILQRARCWPARYTERRDAPQQDAGVPTITALVVRQIAIFAAVCVLCLQHTVSPLVRKSGTATPHSAAQCQLLKGLRVVSTRFGQV